MSDQALYRFFSDAGSLLYVGITDSPSRRFHQHAASKEWWLHVRGISIEWYPDRASVEAAEARAIRIERPAHNVVHNQGNPHRHTEPKRKPRKEAPFVWICVHCHKAISDEAGGLTYNITERERMRIFRDSVEGRRALLRASELPEPPRWRPLHYRCQEETLDYIYTLDVSELRTARGIIDSTAHLLTKTWAEDSGWSNILYHYLNRTPEETNR